MQVNVKDSLGSIGSGRGVEDPLAGSEAVDFFLEIEIGDDACVLSLVLNVENKRQPDFKECLE